MTPRYESALSAKAICAPDTTINSPPRAGPIALATLNATELSATALATMPRGTRSGTVACHEGRLNASPTPSNRPRASRRLGVIRSSAASSAIAPAASPIVDCAATRTHRRSNMSATAPAARERKSNGSVADAAINPTQVADPVSSSISQDAATAWRKEPRFEKIDAIHKALNRGILRGATASTT